MQICSVCGERLAAAGANCSINCDATGAFLGRPFLYCACCQLPEKQREIQKFINLKTWCNILGGHYGDGLSLVPLPATLRHSLINEWMIKFSISEFVPSTNHLFNSSTGSLNWLVPWHFSIINRSNNKIQSVVVLNFYYWQIYDS